MRAGKASRSIRPAAILSRGAGGLTSQLKNNLRTLENIGHFKARELLLVGGGSRNVLWNQIKANMLDIPIKVLDDAETTVSGLRCTPGLAPASLPAPGRPDRRSTISTATSTRKPNPNCQRGMKC